MKKKIDNKSKILVIIITLLVLSVIAFAGPAKAFVIHLVADKSTMIKGEAIVFNASVTINSNDNLQIDKLILELNGPQNIYCNFKPDGTIISGCDGFTIKDISENNNNPGYGYGYSYGYGYGYGQDKVLKYEITLLTENYTTGVYTTSLVIPINEEIFTGNGPSITIKPSEVNPKDNPENTTDSTDDNSERNFAIILCSWDCSQWSSCINGYQTRSCLKRNEACAATNIPVEVQTCGHLKTVNPDDSSDSTIKLNNPNDSNDSTSNITQQNTGYISGMTAAAIAGLTNNPPYTIVILLILIIIVLFLILLTIIIKNSNRRKRIYQLRHR